MRMLSGGINDNDHVQNGHAQNPHPVSQESDCLFSDDESTFVYSENDSLFSDDESTIILTNGSNQMTTTTTKEARSQQVTCQELNNTMKSGMNINDHVQNDHCASSKSDRLFSDDETTTPRTTLDTSARGRMPPNEQGEYHQYELLRQQYSNNFKNKSNFRQDTNFSCEHARRCESKLITHITQPGKELASSTFGNSKSNHTSRRRKRRRIPDVIVVPSNTNMTCSHYHANSNYPLHPPDEERRIFQRRKMYSESTPDISTRSSCSQCS